MNEKEDIIQDYIDVNGNIIKILNLGCGNDFYGTDRIDLYETPATTLVMNIDEEKLPFQNNYFNEIKMEQILEHLKNIGFVIDECFRVLKKGGKIWMRTDCANYIFFYINREHNKMLKTCYNLNSFKHKQNEDSHYHLFVKSHLEKLFKDFSKVEVKYYWGGRNWLVYLIKRVLPFKLGASQIEVFAIK